MTGSSTVRQAEDIGGAELSYAEVKAIASGNPAVLTLAETDAELKRLAVMKKHHADEQFIARRKLRELPVDIARLERRQTGLAQDMATAAAHAKDPISLGERRYTREDAQEALGLRLKTLPPIVHQTTTIPLGVYRGLRFGINLHPQGTPDVQLEGAITRFYQLARDAHGPRAILNAVERLLGTYEGERDKATRDLSIAQTQLRDYEARLGAGFAHTAYLEELTHLRDQLEGRLSGNNPENTGEIVGRIKALRTSNTIEAAPQRTATARTSTIEEPVTARIKKRVQEQPLDVPPEAPPEPRHVLQIQQQLPLAKSTTTRRVIAKRSYPERKPQLPIRQLSLF